MKPATLQLPPTSAKRPPKMTAHFEPTGTQAGVLTITRGKHLDTYECREFHPRSAEAGRAFHLKKLAGGTDKEATGYDCFLAEDDQNTLCGCKGWDSTSGCKHVTALRLLLREGALDVADREMPKETWPRLADLAPAAGYDATDADAALEAACITIDCPVCGSQALGYPTPAGPNDYEFTCTACTTFNAVGAAGGGS